MSVFSKYSRVILSVLLILSFACFFLPFAMNKPARQEATPVTGFELLSEIDYAVSEGTTYVSGEDGVRFEMKNGAERSFVHYYALVLLTLALGLGAALLDRDGLKKYAVPLSMTVVGLIFSSLLAHELGILFTIRTETETILATSRAGIGLILLIVLQALTLVSSILGLFAHKKYAPAPAKKPGRSIAWIARVAVLGAVSAVLYYFEVPVIPPIYKLDLSAVPALIAGFAMGPGASLGVMAVKDLIGLTHTSSMGVGELADFLMSGSMTVVASMIYLKRHTFKGALLGLSIGTLVMGLVGGLANYFIMIPFYVQVMNMPLEVILSLIANTVPAVDSLWKMILLAVVPFNLLKGVVLSVVTMLLYKRIAPMLKNL